MVKKALFTLFTFGLISGHLWAGPVTAEQAAQKAKRFMAAKKGQVELNQTTAYGAAASRNQADAAEPLLHVFNVGQNEGFIIMSGEDSTPEVLAYTNQGSYDYDQLPSNAKAWIDGYAAQIEALRQNVDEVPEDTIEVHATISPLLTCQWNQQSPYNNSCPPFFSNGQSVTGCVATAMAQVLYYHRAKSVPTLQATIPAYQCATNWTDLGRVSVGSFAEGSVIDWGNMLDKYDYTATDAQKKAVADLMAYCGAAIEMNYGRNESSANEMGIPEAFKKYFGYKETATFKYRSHFTPDNWDRLIYRELMNRRPVILSGSDAEKNSGHAFVCDGYDEGYYHINWGWGGLSDGYYLITNLQPSSQGVGGGGSAYNDGVTAVVGMKPGDGTPYEERIRLTMTDFMKPETQTIRFSNDFTLFQWEYKAQNRTTSTRAFDVALALCQNDEIKHILSTQDSIEVNKASTWTFPGYTGGSHTWWPYTYGEATYQVKVFSRQNGTEAWEICADADKWYVDMIIESDQITYVLHQYEEPEVELGLDPDTEIEPEGIEINAENFPDENFRNYLLEQDYGMDALLTKDEIQGITEIDVAAQNISSLKGIEHFTALNSLYCYSNQIKDESMDSLIQSLPQYDTAEVRVLRVYYEGNDENICTKEQVAAARAKGWIPYYTVDGTEWHEYEGYEEAVVPEYEMGDVNGDGMITIADAVATVNYIMGTPNDPFIEEAADMNGDGTITIADVVAIIAQMME